MSWGFVSLNLFGLAMCDLRVVLWLVAGAWEPPRVAFTIKAGNLESRDVKEIVKAIEVAHELGTDESLRIYARIQQLDHDRVIEFIAEYLFFRIDDEQVYFRLLAGTRLEQLSPSYFALDDKRKRNLCRLVADLWTATWHLVPKVVAIDNAIADLEWQLI